MVSLEKVLPSGEQQGLGVADQWHNGQTDEAQLKKLLEDHNRWTGSKRARDLLDNWTEARGKFIKVFPLEYQRALGELHAKKVALAQAASAQAAIKNEAVPAK